MAQEELIFQLSEADEQIIRTYQCTNLKRWFRPPTIGYLTITNKRIVFHSTGKSLTGRSLLLNEMPLDDVAGINVYDGVAINWLFFVVFALIAYFATNIIAGSLPRFLVSYAMVVLLLLPYALIWLLSSNILNEQVRDQIFTGADRMMQGRVQIDRDLAQYMRFARMFVFVGLIILGWRLSERTPLAGWPLLLAVYFFLFTRFFGSQHSFSLLVGSRTMKGAGIFIPGNSFSLLPTRDLTALQALSASPAADAERVMRELGALVMDVQQLGDLAVQKWQA